MIGDKAADRYELRTRMTRIYVYHHPLDRGEWPSQQMASLVV